MTLLLVIAALLVGVVGLLLAFYLDARIDPLVRTGALPTATRRIIKPAWPNGLVGFDFGYIYSRRLRELDDHTRVIVPIIRVCLPLALALAAASIASDWPLRWGRNA